MTPKDGVPRLESLVAGSDGYAVRPVGSWSPEKLYYVRRYIDIFTTAMKTKWPRRVYIDLFSGPGRCVIEDTQQEVDGSPLLALSAKYSFTDVYLNDLDPFAIEALRARVQGLAVRAPVFRTLDCNDAARDAVTVLNLGSDALGLAVVDPTGFQIHFDAIEELSRGRKIDLIITFMSQSLKRFIGEPQMESALDGFFGDRNWRTLVDKKDIAGRVTARALLDHYEDRLRKLGYAHVNDHIRILNSRESPIYHLVFASKHPRGAEFFKKISQKRFSGQNELPWGS